MIEYAIKRNGDKVPFDISKIRKQTEFSTRDTKISSIDFESQLNFKNRSQIKTEDIQYEIISTAVKNISIDTPEWTYVAGRASMYDLYRRVYKQIKIDAEHWQECIRFLVRNDYYRKDILEFMDSLSETQVTTIQNYFTEKNNFDWQMTYPQVETLKNKYLIKNKRGHIEYPIISDIANALVISRGDKYFLDIFEMIHYQYISLASPFKRNLRRPNGNVGSCFIGSMSDNLAGIMKSYTDMANISKEGGGIGWYLGKVRPEDTWTYKVPKANNVTKWIKIINDIAVAVNQGSARPGAITVALDWYHLDIESFLDIKSELNGDLRDKAFDIFPQIVVDRYFMEAVRDNKEVYLFNHFDYKEKYGVDVTELVDKELYDVHKHIENLVNEGRFKSVKKVKAKELWKKVLWTWIEIGDFYITNKDALNKSNYLKTDENGGIAHCANLCVESFSLVRTPTEAKELIKNGKRKTIETNGSYHSCNLLSVNATNLVNKDEDFLRKVMFYSVLMLDRSIDEGEMPVLEAKVSSENLRNIGIGLVGLADMMAYENKMYDQEDGIQYAEKFVEKMAWYAYDASVELAKEYGSYKLFDPKNYDKLFGHTPKELNKMSLNNFDWSEMQKKIKENGIRNFYLLAFAPNSTTGIVQNSVASYLPVYNKEMYQTLSDMSVPIIPKYIKERYWSYKTKFQYHPKDIIYFTRRLQKWIDTGMSMEININPEIAKINEVSDAIVEGFLDKENTLKAVYYSLTIDNNRESACSDCSN